MKDKDLIVVFGSFGSAMKLKKSDVSRKDGSLEYWNFLHILCLNPGIKKIYFIPKSDYRKLTPQELNKIDPYGKILCFQEVLRKKVGPEKVNQENIIENTYFKNYYKLLSILPKPDFGIFYACQGMVTTTSVPKMSYNITHYKKTGEKKYRVPMMMAYRYTAHMVDLVSQSDFPYYVLGPDPRHLVVHPSPNPGGKKIFFGELARLPLKFIAQMNGDVYCKHNPDYKEPHTFKKVSHLKSVYQPIDRINNIGEELKPINFKDKKNDFLITAMWNTNYNWEIDPRYLEIKKWFLGKNLNVKIFGRWPDETLKKHPEFKGFLDQKNLDKELNQTKYTLLIPIDQGWVSSKFTESLVTGTIPFFHPNYDKYNLFLPSDNFLRCNSPEDLEKKIEYLNNNPEKSENIIDKLRKRFLNDDVLSGKFIFQFLNQELENDKQKIRFQETLLPEKEYKPQLKSWK